MTKAIPASKPNWHRRLLVLLCSSFVILHWSFAQQPAPIPATKPATDGKVWGALIYATTDAAKLTGSTEQMPAEDRILLLSVANVILSDKHGSLAEQIAFRAANRSFQTLDSTG